MFKTAGYAVDFSREVGKNRTSLGLCNGRAPVGEKTMAKWWKGVALITTWLSIPVAARAQYLPMSGGSAPVQEPTPISAPPSKPPPKIPEMPEPGVPPLLTDKTFPIGGERGNAFGAEEEHDPGNCQNFGDGCA